MLHEVYLEDQLPPAAFPLSNARRKTQPKATTLKPLVLSNVSVAASAAAAPRDGAVQIAAMGKAATESIATTLSRLGMSAVGQPVLAFVIVGPARTGDEEAAIPSGTAIRTVDGQEKAGDWTKAILLSLDPPTAVDLRGTNARHASRSPCGPISSNTRGSWENRKYKTSSRSGCNKRRHMYLRQGRRPLRSRDQQ